MTAETDRAPLPVPKWYLYFLTGCAFIATTALVLGVWATQVNGQQNRDNTHLLACLDQYASSSSSASSAVRDATVARDQATAARDNTLNAEGRAFLVAVNHILDQDITPADVQNLRDALQDRTDAAEKLDKAQATLDKARRENPVPNPPSVFCQTH